MKYIQKMRNAMSIIYAKAELQSSLIFTYIFVI